MENNISDKDLQLLNKNKSLKLFLSNDRANIPRVLRFLNYENRLKKLQEELIKLQKWVAKNDEKIVIIFEGRDAAGKGGAIRRATEHLNPREFKVVEIGRASCRERV